MKPSEKNKQLQETIFETIKSPAYRSRPAGELANLLNEPDLGEVLAAVNALQEEGKLVIIKKGKIAYPETHGFVRGTYDSAAAGFGFVIPEDIVNGSKTFIPGRYNLGAMHGDLILARVTQAPSRGKNAEGEVVKILKRTTHELCGTFRHLKGRGDYIVPDEKRMGGEINIPKGKGGEAKEGDKVLLKITHYAEGVVCAKGEVLRVLGEAESLGANYLSVLCQYGVRMEFPEEVQAEAKALFQTGVTAESLKNRLDLRGREIFTIDGADAKDFDDAVSLETAKNGNLVLGVHIADVSHYVTPKSPIDKEAYTRGTSIYFIDQVVPMLPYELSNELCSLKPGEDRLAISVFMEVDKSGTVKDYSIRKSVICSCKRCVYGELNAVLEGETDDRYTSVLPTLRKMKELYERLLAQRARRGSVDFETTESIVKLDETGFPVDILPRERGITEKMIEEFMLLANTTVAQHVFFLRMPFIYRVHDVPSGDKATNLVRMAGALGFPIRGIDDGITPKALQAVTEKSKGTPYQRIISTMMLRAMAKAKYSPQDTGHFGLAMEHYCHFTSPIRRYPDLLVHRILSLLAENKLQGNALKGMTTFVQDASLQSSEREVIAQKAERDIDDLYKTLYMRDKVGQSFTGVVVSVTSFGLFVGLPNTVEGLVHISELDDDYYEFDEDHLTLRGSRHKKEYKIGDELRVTLSRTNVIARQIDFTLEEPSSEEAK